MAEEQLQAALDALAHTPQDRLAALIRALTQALAGQSAVVRTLSDRLNAAEELIARMAAAQPGLIEAIAGPIEAARPPTPEEDAKVGEADHHISRTLRRARMIQGRRPAG